GKDRFPAVPNVPPASESGVLPGYDVTTWYGFFGPRGMPPPVVAKLNAAFNDVIAEPAGRERLTTAGGGVAGAAPAARGALRPQEEGRGRAVGEKAGLEQR